MSDPWQEDAEVEDDWEEELTGPAGGNPLDAEELEGDDPDLWADEPHDDDVA
jgi:hypothetical protein